MNKGEDQTAARTLPALAPMPWHDEAWQRVLDAEKAGRLGHALLLVGAAGLGKSRFATRLARHLLCKAGEAEKTAASHLAGGCGHCSSCRSMDQGAHPGYQRLSLDNLDAKQTIPVDAVRQVCANLALTSAGARARVLIIDRADDLNANGFNALLKTLEEPAAGSYLLLLTEALLDLPATIRSRCQQLRFAVPSQNQAEKYLRASVPDATLEDRRRALAASLDAPCHAQLLLEQPELLAQYVEWTHAFQSVLAGQQQATLPQPPSQRTQAMEFARHAGALAWQAARQLMATGSNPAPMLRVAREAAESVQKIEANAQPRLTLESFLVALALARTDAG